MKIISLFLIVFIFIFGGAYSYSEDIYLGDSQTTKGKRGDYYSKEGDTEIPPGMELRKLGSNTILLPKDAKIRKTGNLIRSESANEYAARKFLDMDERFDKIKVEYGVLEEELEDLKKTIRGIKEWQDKLKRIFKEEL